MFKVSQKTSETTGKDGFGRAFCDDSPFAYIFLPSIRDFLQALLIFRAGLLPKFFFFRRTFSSYFYLMPNGHLTSIGGRAAIAILFGNAHIYVLSCLKSVCSFLFHISWGMGSVL